jgi:hypothetical protein
MDDTYKTIGSPSEGLYREKGSRFIAFAFPVSSQEEIRHILEKIRKDHHEASHHCYAWMLGIERTNWRANDDGEPSGTGRKTYTGPDKLVPTDKCTYCGDPLFRRNTPWSKRAYQRLPYCRRLSYSELSGIVECHLREYYDLTFPYNAMNHVMKIFKEENSPGRPAIRN